MDHLGIGVMLSRLSGNEETVNAHLGAIGKIIKSISSNDNLILTFTDETGIRICDEGQSCCEHRYMHTDDEIQYYVGSKFLGCELRSAPNLPDEWGEHEVQFLLVNTDRGTFTMVSHNKHNGYYGGFAIEIRTIGA